MRILSVVGARPQFVKAAAVSREMAKVSSVHEMLVHTGQHFDRNMSDVFFDELGIPPPRHFLGIHGGHHGEMTGRMLQGLERVLMEEHPDYVIVYGDTNSTIAGALAATKLGVPVAHVEAGLRSYNRRMPEEINRVLTDHVSSLLFCPTQAAILNLAKEGIVGGVHHVGDVMYDATLAAREIAWRSNVLQRLDLTADCYAIATIHRAENTDDPARLAAVFDYLRAAASERPVVMPLHPRTREALETHDVETTGLRICEPLSYLDMTRLLAGCSVIYTDSGGLQKEAYFHRKPCVTLRDETEWVETVANGWNRLWRNAVYAPRCEITEYGVGNAARQIVDIILRHAAH